MRTRLLMMIPMVVVALALGVARGGQVSYEELTLEELLAPVRHGHAALVQVRLATPAHVKRAYAVKGGRGKTCAPYDFIAYRGEVERVVRPGSGAPAPLEVGKPVAVVPANVPDLVDLEHRACVEGVRKSPIWPRYAGADPEAGASRLVVLVWQEGFGWVESVAGAWLLPSELARVQALLDKKEP